MNLDKKSLDRRNTQDWNKVQSIPLPFSKKSTSKTEKKQSLKPLKFVDNKRQDLDIKDNQKDVKNTQKEIPAEKPLINVDARKLSSTQKSVEDLKKKYQYDFFLLKHYRK